MWGRHRKRTARLPKQLALGLLEDAMGRAEQKGPERQGGPKQPGGPEQQGRPEQQGAPERQEAGELAQAAPYPGAAAAPQAVPSTRSGLEPADVRADTSAGPTADDAVPRQRQCGDERTGKSTRHGSLG